MISKMRGSPQVKSIKKRGWENEKEDCDCEEGRRQKGYGRRNVLSWSDDSTNVCSADVVVISVGEGEPRLPLSILTKERKRLIRTGNIETHGAIQIYENISLR